jgi:hypothetical protein
LWDPLAAELHFNNMWMLLFLGQCWVMPFHDLSCGFYIKGIKPGFVTHHEAGKTVLTFHSVPLQQLHRNILLLTCVLLNQQVRNPADTNFSVPWTFIIPWMSQCHNLISAAVSVTVICGFSLMSSSTSICFSRHM